MTRFLGFRGVEQAGREEGKETLAKAPASENRQPTLRGRFAAEAAAFPRFRA
jgi:hypothetical protein